MVDMVYFLICLGVSMFVCVWLGWMIGYKDGRKNKINKKRG